MKILAIGNLIRFKELKSRLDDSVELIYQENISKEAISNELDFIFDLNFDDGENWKNLNFYKTIKIPTIVSAVKIQLENIFQNADKKALSNVIGANLLPTFINRSLLEVSLHSSSNLEILDELKSKLNLETQIVQDRVGMVTPRVIFMIINEAFYTLQEGTATIEDIDKGMELGTNYPFGPFEWADKIGIKNVYQTLSAIYEDTKEERYKICPLLKSQSFQ